MAQTTSLFLAPTDDGEAPDLAAIRQVLDDLSIIDGGLGTGTYAAGKGFSRQVVYAGCSPHLAMQPPEKGSLQFCHVALHGPYPSARLVTGPNTVKPRCPRCRTRIADWRERLPDWVAGTQAAHCDACGFRCPAGRLDWRGHAISGRVLVELRNVFPGEATPSDLLMQRLEAATGCNWRYAWAASHTG